MNLESMLMLHPDDEDAELLRIIKKPIEILRTRLSSTPVRARAAILHSLDRGAQTIPEFVTETRLTRADILKHLDEMIADKVIEKVPDGRTSNKQGPTLYIYIRFGAPTGDNYVAPVRGSSSTARLTSAFDD
jgi:predicted transcriptional regulator